MKRSGSGEYLDAAHLSREELERRLQQNSCAVRRGVDPRLHPHVLVGAGAVTAARRAATIGLQVHPKASQR